MCQEIQATLTEMESCMRLLLPDCGLTDTQTVSGSPPNCPPDEEQPCCSKDVRDDWEEGKREEREDSGKGPDMGKEKGKTGKGGEGDEEEQVGDGKETEEGEEDDDEEEDRCDEDLFCRNSGLISYSYSLDLNLSPGE